MSKTINLRIAEPCHENWDNMTPVEQGKFCGSCQKQVVDFTNMSDRQVAEFFKQPSTGSVCGRFMTDQLERDIEVPRKRIPWIKYFFSIALPAFFLSKASAQKMGKPAITERKDTAVTPSVTPFNRILGMVAPSNIVPVETDKVPINKINGLKVWIVDAATGLPIEGATVTLNTSAGKPVVLTDNEGMVLLDIYRKQTFHGIDIAAPGYTERTISYGAFKKEADGRILFRMDKLPAVKDEPVLYNTDSIIPVRVMMGAVAYPIVNKIQKDQMKGVVENENGEPVPFASISGSKKGEVIIADENGEFIIKKDWLKKGKSIEVTSAGYTAAAVASGTEVYRDGTLVVRLRSVMMDEVRVTSFQGFGCSRTTGLVMVKVGEVINTTKEITTTNKETIPAMEETQLQVYPNPARAAGTVHIGFKQPVEGYYELQLISTSGQLIKKQELWLDAEARLLDIELPPVTAGTYFIILTNRKTGKKYSDKLLVQ